jgi:hypothetical protein
VISRHLSEEPLTDRERDITTGMGLMASEAQPLKAGVRSLPWTYQPDHLEIVDVLRDDTFTVLFQKNGICYGVVTLPEYEAWLIEILKTWEFTD